MTPPATGPSPWLGPELAVIFLVYWSPTLYAVIRGKQGAVRIGLMNFWAFLAVPWLTAWITALTAPKRISAYPIYSAPAPSAPTPTGPPPGFEEHTILLPKDSEGSA